MAWWLVDSILKGTLDEDYPIMSKKNDDVTILGGEEDNSRVSAELPTGNVYAADTVSFDYNWWADD